MFAWDQGWEPPRGMRNSLWGVLVCSRYGSWHLLHRYRPSPNSTKQQTLFHDSQLKLLKDLIVEWSCTEKNMNGHYSLWWQSLIQQMLIRHLGCSGQCSVFRWHTPVWTEERAWLSESYRRGRSKEGSDKLHAQGWQWVVPKERKQGKEEERCWGGKIKLKTRALSS